MDALTRLRYYVADQLTVKNFAVLLALVAIGGGVTMALDRTGTTQLAENATFPGSGDTEAASTDTAAVNGETLTSGAITVTTLPSFPPVDSSTFAGEGDIVESEVATGAEESVLDQAESSAQSFVDDTAAVTTLVRRPSATVTSAVPSTAVINSQVSAASRNQFAALDFGSSVAEVDALFGGGAQSLTVPGASGVTAFVWTASTGESVVTVFKADRLVAKSRF